MPGIGPAEAFTPEQFAQVYDINVLNTQRVNRAALPEPRKQGRGLVVWVSSSSTRGSTPPYLSPYFAAKAAMELAGGLLRRRAHWWRCSFDPFLRLRRAGAMIAWVLLYFICTPQAGCTDIFTARGLRLIGRRTRAKPTSPTFVGNA